MLFHISLYLLFWNFFPVFLLQWYFVDIIQKTESMIPFPGLLCWIPSLILLWKWSHTWNIRFDEIFPIEKDIILPKNIARIFPKEIDKILPKYFQEILIRYCQKYWYNILNWNWHNFFKTKYWQNIPNINWQILPYSPLFVFFKPNGQHPRCFHDHSNLGNFL